MKKKGLFFGLLYFVPLLLTAQAQEAALLGTWIGEDIPGSFAYDNAYNEVWGLAVNGREFAVVGSTKGTHFIDVTNPAAAEEVAFVPGTAQGGQIIHRDYHDYNGYLYAACDEGQSTLQIMDIRQLPDTVILAYNSNELVKTAHNLFIDTATARLYFFALNGGPQFYSAMRIYDIAEPLTPQFLGEYSIFGTMVAGHVHDGYVRNNIAFLNCGYDGFAIVDFTDVANPQTLKTISTYPFAGYNHSGWVTDDGQYYYMGDENHGYRLKVLDISDPCEAEVVHTFDAEVPNPTSITHNQIVACNYLYTSYYYDGMQIFDISNPEEPQKVWYYDTSELPDNTSYEGAWGIYPFLPSGNILVTDMQAGLFILEGPGDNCMATQTLNDIDLSCTQVSSNTMVLDEEALRIYPQPAQQYVQMDIHLAKGQEKVNTGLFDIHGRLVHRFEDRALLAGQQTIRFDLPKISAGIYFLNLQGNRFQTTQKVVIATEN